MSAIRRKVSAIGITAALLFGGAVATAGTAAASSTGADYHHYGYYHSFKSCWYAGKALGSDAAGFQCIDEGDGWFRLWVW